MKNLLNLALGIDRGHFHHCTHVRGFRYVTDDPACRCEEKRYRLTLQIGLTMFVFELLGGLLTNSLSLVGDSLHLLADSTAIAIGLIVLWAVARNHKKKGSYHKTAVIINGSLLLLSSLYLLFESFFKFLYPSATAGFAMTIIASIGIVGNFIQHHILISIRGRSGKEDLVHTSIVLHIFSDLLQSFVVVIGGLCIIFMTNFKAACIIDPMLSTGLGFIMSMYAINLIFKAFHSEDGHDHHDHHHH